MSTLRRVLVTFSLLLTFVFGAPKAAQAADLPSAGHLTLVICPGDAAVVFYGATSVAPQTGNVPTLVETLYKPNYDSVGWRNPGTVSVGSSTACSNNIKALPTSGTVTANLLTYLNSDSAYEANSSYTYTGLGIVVGSTQYSIIKADSNSFANNPAIFVVDYGAGGSGASAPQITPMVPTDKPTVSVTSTTISCTLGTYSQVPTSAAFSLFVDGSHIATNYSMLGDYLPNWMTPWASADSISRTASLTGAEWELKDSYKGKSITCATLAYSKTAIGLTQSAPHLVAK